MARPRSDIRARVVDAARARFLAEGVDGASLRSIAHDAGTSIGMIYYYFPTKDDLFLGVVEGVYAGLLADITTALAPDVAVDARIERLSLRIAALSDDEFAVIRIVIREALVSSARLGRLIALMLGGHLPLVAGTLAEGAANGTLRADVPIPALMASLGGIAVVPQIVLRLLAAQPNLPIELPDRAHFARRLVQLLLGGIAHPAPATVPSLEPASSEAEASTARQ